MCQGNGTQLRAPRRNQEITQTASVGGAGSAATRHQDRFPPAAAYKRSADVEDRHDTRRIRCVMSPKECTGMSFASGEPGFPHICPDHLRGYKHRQAHLF